MNNLKFVNFEILSKLFDLCKIFGYNKRVGVK